MTLFPIPDDFYSNPKYLNWSPEAYTLWLKAGSWSCHHLTDGSIPSTALALFPAAIAASADELVGRRIWKRARGGYRYVEWPRECTREYVLAKREADRLRKQRQRGSTRASERAPPQVKAGFVPGGHTRDSRGESPRESTGESRRIQ